MRKKREWKRASLTVEASLVMGLVLMVVTCTIYLFLFVHDRAYLTCSACEAALSGAMATSRANEGVVWQSARTKGVALGKGSLCGHGKLSTGVRIDPALTGLKVVVEYRDAIRPLFGFPSWPIEVQMEARILYPVQWIRNARAAADLLFGRS